MDAIIDTYAQMTVRITEKEAKYLQEQRELISEIWRTDGKQLPLRLYLKETGWRAEGVPQDCPWEEKQAYEIDIPPSGIESIMQGKIIGTDIVTVKLRKLHMGLENSTEW